MGYTHFQDIHKDFGQHKVLKGITLDIEKGHLVTLLGPSGCGKSTLLRCLAGLEEVTSGTISLDGKDITHVNPRDRGIGMVFQQYSLFPNMSVAQNVAFGLNMKKVPKDIVTRKVGEMLTIVGLDDKADQYPSQLSGGQQQRVALARALVTEPKVLLLDEPLSAIDALLRRNLQVEIRRIQKEMGITTLFVTHDQDEAMVMSDRIYLFNVGTIEQADVPVELYTRPRTKFAAAFIGHYNIVDAAVFGKQAGMEFAAKDLAIRPEVFEISSSPIEREGAAVLKGTVLYYLSHGNIMRYTVDCGEFQIDVDILFDSTLLFDSGTPVYIAAGRENILELGG